MLVALVTTEDAPFVVLGAVVQDVLAETIDRADDTGACIMKESIAQ